MNFHLPMPGSDDSDFDSDPDSDSPRREVPEEAERMMHLAQAMCASFVNGFRQQDIAAPAAQLINILYFMLTVTDAFGGKFVPVRKADSEGIDPADLIRDSIGAEDEDEYRDESLILVDSLTGAPITSNIILQRINAVLAMMEHARKAGKDAPDIDDELADGDI